MVRAARVSLCMLLLAFAGSAAADVTPSRLPLVEAMQRLKADEQAASYYCGLAVLNRTKTKVMTHMLVGADGKLAQVDRSLRTIRAQLPSLPAPYRARLAKRLDRIAALDESIERGVRRFERDLRRGSADEARTELSALEPLEHSATAQKDAAIADLARLP